jgi:hypothetical protein
MKRPSSATPVQPNPSLQRSATRPGPVVLKWSDYHKGLYAHFFFIPELPGHELYLRWSIAQLEAALAAEQGKISAENSVSFKRQMNQLMRGFAGSGGRARSADNLQPLENQAAKYYGGTVTCVATELNRVYDASVNSRPSQ